MVELLSAIVGSEVEQSIEILLEGLGIRETAGVAGNSSAAIRVR